MSDRKITTKKNEQENAHILYGEETNKALRNFIISPYTMPSAFLRTLAIYKSACAQANLNLGLLSNDKSNAIQKACAEIEAGKHEEQFPIDVFQTGSGTSTNMNMNEVLANLAYVNSQEKVSVHPNDDVNKGQSSNDVIPSCIHISASLAAGNELIPAIDQLAESLQKQAAKHNKTFKTARTHLMDAMPMSFAQELGAWRQQLVQAKKGLSFHMTALSYLATGGTAVGTGVNCHPKFAEQVSTILSQRTGFNFKPAANHFSANSSQDTAVNFSGQLKTLSVSLHKIANDIRWLSSGPLNGLNEIKLKELQKGSSIMPGKTNPVISEAVMMACARVIGNDTTITLAGQGGNFQLNTMLPLIAFTLLDSIALLSNACKSLADKVVDSMEINSEQLASNLERNPILATALNDRIGYDKSAEIAKKAYAEKRTVLEVAKELTDINESELKNLLNPALLTTNKN
ncbi:MAG: fumarate hydratase class II [Glaciecola sp.]|jgi:fumarate hydratase class II